ncbi:MAG: hypothetical protein LBU34_04275 [Planctomycetaceae bacterium]|nr:hypothetical protein [Planctomycetaceae bacterium]
MVCKDIHKIIVISLFFNNCFVKSWLAVSGSIACNEGGAKHNRRIRISQSRQPYS